MLTNETIRKIHDNAVAHGFHEPDSEPTFGEYCALIHEEISEAFSAWRNGEPDEYVDDDGKPQGVWVELADVVIRCADAMATYGYKFHDNMSISTKIARYSMSFFINKLHDTLVESKSCYPDDTLSQVIWMIYFRSIVDHIDLDAVIERKHAYNVTRPYKHGKRM